MLRENPSGELETLQIRMKERNGGPRSTEVILNRSGEPGKYEGVAEKKGTIVVIFGEAEQYYQALPFVLKGPSGAVVRGTCSVWNVP